MDNRNDNTVGDQDSELPIPPPSVSEQRQRRGRLPVKARLLLDDSLAANEHHPLARSAPEVRAVSRLRLIASILARMARAGLARK
jgi:hypothetical protein